MTLIPREYQTEFVNDLADSFRTNQCVVGVVPTGGGKTPVTVMLADRSQKKGKEVIVTLPRKELMRQTANTFNQFHVPFGYIASGAQVNPFSRINLASMPTLVKRYEKYSPGFLIVDEGHFSMAAGWRRVIESYMKDKCKVLLLTASPERLDGQGLGQLATALVEGPKPKWLIDNKFLSDYKAYCPSEPDLRGIHKSMGDHKNSDLSTAMDKPSVTGIATNAWGTYARGKRTICYCVSREHSRNTVDMFNAAGIPAEHMDGDTPDSERKKIIQRFANGQTLVLCNVEICTVGFDLSAQIGRDVPIEAVSLLRPTLSRALHIQMVGRALRKKDYPAIILDHAGSLIRHGFPCESIEWSLEGSKGSKGAGEATIPLCKCSKCHYAQRAVFTFCPDCGHERETSSREIEFKDGELKEIDVEAMRLQEHHDFVAAKIEERNCKNLHDWLALAKQRGHKPGWAYHRQKLVEAKKRKA